MSILQVPSPDVVAQLHRARGQRMRVQYRTRTWTDPRGSTYAVLGNNRMGHDGEGVATIVARIGDVYDRHVVVQSDQHTRAVVLHIVDVVGISAPLVGGS